jgi:hypothetical protein
MYDSQTFCQPCFTAKLAIKPGIDANIEQPDTLKVTFAA